MVYSLFYVTKYFTYSKPPAGPPPALGNWDVNSGNSSILVTTCLNIRGINVKLTPF